MENKFLNATCWVYSVSLIHPNWCQSFFFYMGKLKSTKTAYIITKNSKLRRTSYTSCKKWSASPLERKWNLMPHWKLALVKKCAISFCFLRIISSSTSHLLLNITHEPCGRDPQSHIARNSYPSHLRSQRRVTNLKLASHQTGRKALNTTP